MKLKNFNPFGYKKIPIGSFFMPFVEIIVECTLKCERLILSENLGTIKYRLPMINSCVVKLPLNNVYEMSSLPGILNMHPSLALESRMNSTKKIVNANSYLLDPYTGEGIGIAILDTGISPIEDFTNPYNRIIAFKDFTQDITSPYDNNGHGTHVSGIASGNGYFSYGKYAGIAPKSNIISVKILDENGQGSSSQALAGIQWVIENRKKYNIKIINLSIGTNYPNLNIPLIKAINSAWDNGLVVVAADANCGTQSKSITSSGNNPKIITVGTYDNKCNTCNIAFGRNNPNPDILAPGTDIISCMSPDYCFESKSRAKEKIVDDYYVKMSGTSMATPIVSGAAALLLQKYPNLKPSEVKRMLIQSSAVKSNDQVYLSGLLNIGNLLL